MSPDKYQLLHLFNDLVKISLKNPGKPGFNNPCSYLIEMLIIGQDVLINNIISNDSGELRLNGVGLKLYWRIEKQNAYLHGGDDNCGPIQVSRFLCNVGGDQADFYPDFVKTANMLMLERSCSK